MTTLKLARCKLVVTMDDAGTELVGASILIRDGWIEKIGDAPESADSMIDCGERLVIPGLINSHHHLYQTLTRGFPQSAGQGLFDWLQTLYPIWAGLDEDMIHASTRAGLSELALSGCTTCADHLYLFPANSAGFIDAEIAAAREVGMRFHCTRGSMDLSRKDGGLPPDSVVQSIGTILEDSERVISKYHDPSPGSMLHIGLAPCSPFSVTPDLMQESAELARAHGVRLHTHIAETLDEERYSQDVFGMSPIQLLETLGWIGPDVWVAHCVHPDEHDMNVLAAGRVGVAHCPTSNMLLGSGLTPTVAFLKRGIAVGLGVDGSASNDGNDLKGEVKQAILSARVRDGATAMSVRQALRMATRGGATCLGRTDIGSIQAGKAADLVTFDVGALQSAGGQEDIVAATILGAVRPHDVIVHGRHIVRNGLLEASDAHMIAQEQNRQSGRLMSAHRA